MLKIDILQKSLPAISGIFGLASAAAATITVANIVAANYAVTVPAASGALACFKAMRDTKALYDEIKFVDQRCNLRNSLNVSADIRANSLS